MTFPIFVTQSNGTFTASVLGAPQVSAEGTTKEQAIATVTAQLRHHITTGDVVLVDMEASSFAGLSGLAGKYKDDPTLREICEEAYRLRDAERDVEVSNAHRP
jgi:hypothetical protein